jgi:DNA polymerase III delta subunit
MRSSSAAAALKEITTKGECPSCVVITSPDRVRRERALEYLLTRFAKATNSTPRTFSFGEQGRNSPSAFLRDLEEPSLFEPTRFAVIRSIESAKAADVEPVSEFLRKEVPGVHLFIVGESLPNTPNFKKTLDALATQLPFEPLKGAELNRWVEREVAQSGIQGADDEVIELLISLGSDDPETISRLVEKFALYLGDSKASRNALKALEPGRATASDFELAETLLGKNRAQTETLLVQLLAQGSSPFMLLGLLTKTFASLYRIRVLLDRGISQNVIKNDLGISPWLFSKYLPLAQRTTSSALASTLEALLVADFRLKDRSIGPAGILSSVATRTAPGGRS